MNKKMISLICVIVILLGTMILPINGLAEGSKSTTVTSEMQQIVEESLPKLSEPPKKRQKQQILHLKKHKLLKQRKK